MTIGKFPFFLILFFLIGIPMVAPRLIWLARSRTVKGIMGFAGRGTVGEQLQQTYDYMYIPSGDEKIWVNVSGGTGYQPGDSVSLRYLPSDGINARVNSLIGLWGDILVYEGIPELMLLISFLHPQVVPGGSKLRLSRRRPFVYICS